MLNTIVGEDAVVDVIINAIGAIRTEDAPLQPVLVK
jgi:hypothetical protein